MAEFSASIHWFLGNPYLAAFAPASTVTTTFSTSPATPGHSSQTTTTASLPTQPDLGLRSLVSAVGIRCSRSQPGATRRLIRRLPHRCRANVRRLTLTSSNGRFVCRICRQLMAHGDSDRDDDQRTVKGEHPAHRFPATSTIRGTSVFGQWLHVRLLERTPHNRNRNPEQHV